MIQFAIFNFILFFLCINCNENEIHCGVVNTFRIYMHNIESVLKMFIHPASYCKIEIFIIFMGRIFIMICEQTLVQALNTLVIPVVPLGKQNITLNP